MAQIPYEFLVRWNYKTGVLSGAHIKFFDSTTNQEGDAQSVALAGATGFPLAGILTTIESGAILAAENAVAALKVANDTIAAKDAELAALQAQLAAIKVV